MEGLDVTRLNANKSHAKHVVNFDHTPKRFKSHVYALELSKKMDKPTVSKLQDCFVNLNYSPMFLHHWLG